MGKVEGKLFSTGFLQTGRDFCGRTATSYRNAAEKSNLLNRIYFVTPLTMLVATARPAPVRDTGPEGKIRLELEFGAWIADQGEHCRLTQAVPPS